MQDSLDPLLDKIRSCELCKDQLPLGTSPVIQASSSARILIIGQAPGLKVHESGIPWNDASGERLRSWLKVDEDLFYNPDQFAIMPMAFCYPGRGKSGDLPPDKRCAPTWHKPLKDQLPEIKITLLIGQYAQKSYLGNAFDSLTQAVKHQPALDQGLIALPHPSPRNNIWLRKHSWFESEVLPLVRKELQKVLIAE